MQDISLKPDNLLLMNNLICLFVNKVSPLGIPVEGSLSFALINCDLTEENPKINRMNNNILTL